jgi:uncharacterized YigZ family protein
MATPNSFLTITQDTDSEFVVKSSKFIAFASHVETSAEIHQKLQEIKSKHPKANHWCYAWKLGTDNQQNRAFDDGEPSGTAGKPILNQLESLNLTNTIVIVVRYFGGTLLGTSGLIKAYKEATRNCLSKSQMIPVISCKKYRIQSQLPKIQSLLGILKALNITILKYSFSDPCFILFEIPADEEYLWFAKIKSRFEKINNQQIENPKSIAGCLLIEDEL